MTPGLVVFATCKVFNGVGLYSYSVSRGVIVSPSPKLSVIDGHKTMDEDYVSTLNVIQGQWIYSDPCPILSAEWSVEDLRGNVVQDFKSIANDKRHFFNDELATENDQTYINIIRIVDVLNRTKTARSDGITILIQPPKLANVRDGLENEDINYQRSTKRLSGNWDDFGDSNHSNSSQSIVRYEVAIGNDRRYPNTRTNVHGFVDVGLNNSVTFTNLNLKAKLVRYYLTVRAYSAAGSFIEGYSNGLRVGYEEIIKPGELSYSQFQSSTTSIVIGWTNFISDYGIRRYETAVSSVLQTLTNDTIKCSFFKRKSDAFDVHPLQNVGMNTFVEIRNLSLQHGKSYYVSVVAKDESGSCILVTTDAILVDTTKPVVGKLYIDDTEAGEHYNFVTTSQRITVSWNGFSDVESGIGSYHIQLAKQQRCPNGFIPHNVIQEQTVNTTEATFYHLETDSKYTLKFTAFNGANLNCSTTIVNISVDENVPATGKVKAGENWFKQVSVQHSKVELHATLLISRTEDGYLCPLQNDISPSKKQTQSVWHPLSGNYSSQCVKFTDNELLIEVRTDDHIFTEVVKGGVQSDKINVLEGTYTVKMIGLSGDHIVSSVALTQDLTTVPIQFSEAIEDTRTSGLDYNETNSELPNDGIKKSSKKDRYGTGFLIPGYRLGNDTNSWYILFWAADMYELREKWITIDFNPTLLQTNYDFILAIENKTDTVTWQVTFLINGKEMASISFLKFEENFRLYIHGYNKNDFVPDVVDIFNPFYSKLLVNTVFIPSQNDALCKHGKAFYDGESGIHEIWVGVSNSQNETENVMPYALQRTFCLPCQSTCESVCDPGCDLDITSPLEVIHVTVSNLTLVASSNVSTHVSTNISSGSDFDSLQAEAYYINVKVLDFAGHQVEAISGAVIIDDTPPEFRQLSCVDPANSLDEPAIYQGTNSSVAAFWDCFEDISQIQRYTVCVGTSEGVCDIQRKMNAGLQTSALIDGLENVLVDGTTYFLTVTATNEANMNTSESCNITVEMAAPNTDRSGSKELFSVAVEDAPAGVAFSDRTDRLGIQWQITNDDTEFFEWEIGSSSTVADIFPRVKIGTKNSKKVAIIDGHLWLDGININATVKEYVLTNWTEDEIARAKTHGAFFNFEPGRCIHVNLYSVNRAHLSSKIPVKPVCMKRKNDVVINLENHTALTLTKVGSHLQRSTGSRREDTDVSIRLRGSSGGLMVGLLDSSDLEAIYGSAASDEYSPYIASPVTQTLTSRLLRRRFRSYSGLSFYAAPVGHAQLTESMAVSLRFNKTDANNSKPSLVYWDQVEREWRHITEDCNAEENVDYNTRTYTAKICMPYKDNGERKRRSLLANSDIDGPRQFSLIFMSEEIVQTPPSIDTTSLTYTEDPISVELRTIRFTDAEGDDVTFQLVSQPIHGYANITENGLLYYKPHKDFAGTDEVQIECLETTLPAGIVATPIQTTLHVFVTEVNDAPDLIFIRNNNTFLGKRSHGIVLPMESNSTGYVIGTFLASDIDVGDNLVEKVYETSTPNSNFTLYEIEDTMLLKQLSIEQNKVGNTQRAFELQLSMSTDFFGVLEYGLIMHDRAGHWSLPITLKIGILYNPCVHGSCAPKDSLPCTDLSRAESFSHFHCKCQLGYEGKWCETETNECAPQPCALMFDCEDLIAEFRCNINIAKLVAILLCSLLALVLIGFAIYSKKKSLKNRMKVSNTCLNEMDVPQCSSVPRFAKKYGFVPFEEQEPLPSDSESQKTDDDWGLSETYLECPQSETVSSENDKHFDEDDLAATKADEITLDKVVRGVQLPSVGTFRPPHHGKTNNGKFRSNFITPIDV